MPRLRQQNGRGAVPVSPGRAVAAERPRGEGTAPTRGQENAGPEVLPWLSRQNGACRASPGRTEGDNTVPAEERAPGAGQGEARQRRESAVVPRRALWHRTGLWCCPRPPTVPSISSQLKKNKIK